MNESSSGSDFLHKIEQQQELIRQLTEENETLYQQFNHLMVRNNKLLKRIDDQQRIIDDLHIRLEESQLIFSNQLQINDSLRRRIPDAASVRPSTVDRLNMETLFNQWKNFPGQSAHNAPNLRKQVLLLATLFGSGPLNAHDLFQQCDIGGVTGARYVAHLKKSGLVTYVGARKKGRYELTPEGIRFVTQAVPKSLGGDAQVPGLPAGIPLKSSETSSQPG